MPDSNLSLMPHFWDGYFSLCRVGHIIRVILMEGWVDGAEYTFDVQGAAIVVVHTMTNFDEEHDLQQLNCPVSTHWSLSYWGFISGPVCKFAALTPSTPSRHKAKSIAKYTLLCLGECNLGLGVCGKWQSAIQDIQHEHL